MISSTQKLSYLTLCLFAVGCGGGSSKDKDPQPYNSAPVAHITMEKTQFAENEAITFSAEKSQDPNGDKITYQWQLIGQGGETLALEDVESETIQYTPQHFGTYSIELTVKDDKSAADKITQNFIVIPSEDDYPVASIDAKSKAKVGAVHWFTAEDSRAAGDDRVIFDWRLKSKPEGSNAEMQNGNQVKSYFVADKPGNYQVILVVANIANELSSTSTFDVEVTELTTNSEPVANITSEQREFSLNEVIQLNALNSFDADEDLLSYQWQIEEKPENSSAELSVSEDTYAQFKADVIGEYRVKLQVADKETDDETTLSIKVTGDNVAPVANAGPDVISALDVPIILDGRASQDPEGQPLQYEWSLLNRPANSEYEGLQHITLRDEAYFEFLPDALGLYTLHLRVFDGQVYSKVDTLTVEVTENQKPVALLPDNIVVTDAGVVTIYGTDSYDPEQQNLTYNWQFNDVPAGYNGQISHANGKATFFPTELGTYTVQLIVNDGQQDSAPVTMVIERQETPTYMREVSGRLVDSGGNPIVNARVGGILQQRTSTDSDGNFSLTFYSHYLGANLSYISFNIDNKIIGMKRLAEENSETPINAGDVLLPVLQRKDITLTACEGYTGPTETTVLFAQRQDGYNGAKFLKPAHANLTIGAEPVEIQLPAYAVLSLRAFQSAATVTETQSGKDFITHTFQADDSKQDSLSLTICN
ncbi:PKD domain-containing protein [Thalassotalea marina]|uniref:PKD/Chitinase domain-containing protein n=1 Tax=Thalassotalea marina TaxID=1673741 RepID=A0A919ELQ4_9GAMM|nr:PKD domain-containing protein [Thalassotalea marina]GHF95961.1 hypothetical protein GCM10017161_25350 [Thalassotalea marina]